MRRVIIVGLTTVAVSGFAGVRYGERNLADFAKRDANGAIDIVWRAGDSIGVPDFSATFSDYKFGLKGLYVLFY